MSNPEYTRNTNVRLTPCTPSQKESSSRSSSGSSSTTTVENDHILLRNRVEQLRELYTATIGVPMTPAVMRQLLLSVTRGTPWQYYEYALEETALAPRPSWRYALAIVTRLISEQAPADDVRGSQRHTKRVREQEYTQREYVHDESRIDAMMAEFFAQQQ